MVVLVVDDSGPVRARLMAMIAEVAGVEVRQARDAIEAAAALAAAPIDVIILDLHLPDGSGLLVLDRAKAKNPAVVVVVLTNDASEQHRRECLLHGADYFFDKSHHFAHAVDIVRALSAVSGLADEHEGPTRLS